MEDDQLELQLLPAPAPDHAGALYSRMSPWTLDLMRYRSDNIQIPLEISAGPSLDLQLSIRPAPESFCFIESENETRIRLEELKWHAYAERVREMTKREMELAQSELTRARHMWEHAREEMERAEKMKQRATRRINSSCMEITCQACSQKFPVTGRQVDVYFS
ncbi:hypothetical protein E3N88_39470 [Mikania micrantha]|uniref:Uncharacterized protein n=1 Tax=Mikania micrantha TaxID=192012 RepID=A0A5N6LWV0_9ASTR|nr:hypothetical protein E3N88_39470 [Mikania micrantha]